MEKFTSQTSLIKRGADFESRESFNAHSAVVNPTAEKLDYSGMPLDWSGDGEYATSLKETHCMIVGDTGCGKTRRLIIPTIKLISKTGQSMILSDPKGELYRKTSAGLKSKGYEVKIINMREPRRGDRWNPFSKVDELYRSGDLEKKDKAMLLLDEILDVMRRANHSERDPYWEQSATQYMKGLCLMILEHEDKGMLSFNNLALTEARVSNLLIANCEDDMDEGNNRERIMLRIYLNGLDQNSDIFQNLQSVISVMDVKNTLQCIVSSAHTMVSQYTRQEAIRYLFSESDFSIDSIGEKPTAVFMVIPDDSEALYPLATLFVDQVYSAMIDLAYCNGGVTPNHVNFILDEFANFTRLPKIRSMLTASRSRGMRFFLVVQDVDQLEEQYGPKAASTVMSNCHAWIYMGCRNIEFLKMLREISGFYTEKYTGYQYPLLDLNDMLTLRMGETIVWNKGCNPKRCWLPDYSEVKFEPEEDSDKTESDFPKSKQDCSIKSIDIIKTISAMNEENKEEDSPSDFVPVSDDEIPF